MAYEVLKDTEKRFWIKDTQAQLRLDMHKTRTDIWLCAIKDLTTGWITTASPFSKYPAAISQLHLNNTTCLMESCAGLGGLMPQLTRLNGSRPGRLVVVDMVNYEAIRSFLENINGYRTAPDEQTFFNTLIGRCEFMLGSEIELHNCTIKEALQDPSLIGSVDVLVENHGPASKSYRQKAHKRMDPAVYDPFLRPNGIKIIN